MLIIEEEEEEERGGEDGRSSEPESAALGGRHARLSAAPVREKRAGPGMLIDKFSAPHGSVAKVPCTL